MNDDMTVDEAAKVANIDPKFLRAFIRNNTVVVSGEGESTRISVEALTDFQSRRAHATQFLNELRLDRL